MNTIKLLLFIILFIFLGRLFLFIISIYLIYKIIISLHNILTQRIKHCYS